MHRLKLIALLLFLVLGLGLASFMVVRNDFGPRITKAAADDLTKTQLQVQALKFARGRRLVKVADWLARNEEISFVKALREATDEARHREAFSAIARIKPLLQKTKRLDYVPDVTLVLSPQGKIIARNRFETRSDTTLTFPLIARVVAEKTRDQDIWRYREQNERMMTVALAPILDGANVAGVLALLYEHNNQMAVEDRKAFRAEVAYFHDDKLYGSSLAEPAQIESLRGFVVPNKADLQAGKVVGPTPIDVAGKKFIALAAQFNSDATDRAGGFIIATSLDDALAPVSAFLGRFPFIAVGFLLIAILLGLFILRSVTAPYDRIEQGVLEMVAGNTDHRFDTNLPGGAGTLAHALNLLVAQLQGRPPPDREPEDMAWADPFFIADLSAEEIKAHHYEAAAAHRDDLDSQMGLTLAYYEKLFKDYVDARARAGERGAEIDMGPFVDKVRKNEEVLRRKYRCAAVKFEVLVKEGKVILKPVPIK
jgi:hypothetical protein